MNTLKDKQSQDIFQKAQESNEKTCSEILANTMNAVPRTGKLSLLRDYYGDSQKYQSVCRQL